MRITRSPRALVVTAAILMLGTSTACGASVSVSRGSASGGSHASGHAAGGTGVNGGVQPTRGQPTPIVVSSGHSTDVVVIETEPNKAAPWKAWDLLTGLIRPLPKVLAMIPGGASDPNDFTVTVASSAAAQELQRIFQMSPLVRSVTIEPVS